ncbi:MAG: phosphoglucomutase [Chlamydiota bacterium]|jgi:phosphoglucomutase/phosphomannomutase
MTLPSAVQKRIDYWLNGPFDETTKQQVRALSPEKLRDAFSSDLSFGTGGMRALMGVGTSHINIYTIRLATQGLANYLKTECQNPSVVIGFDSRHNSLDFAKQAAAVLAGNGIAVHFIGELRPTPYISFACRHFKASAAIMITASHNPKEYNGYKVYWADGAQVVHPHDEGIVAAVHALKDLSSVHIANFDNPQISAVRLEELDKAYLNAIAPLAHFNDRNHKEGSCLKIIYSSLHGTGITMIPKALFSWGFSNVHLVDAQVTIDGNFPTVAYPNPEYKETMRLSVEALIKKEGDIAIVSDPDADRLGVAILHQGVHYLFSGNEMAALCTDFLCCNSSGSRAVVTTIVTTELLKAICKAFNVELVEVLTGFKYIGEKIHLWEEKGDIDHFLFGAEESYGSLFGTHARDKDAIIASCLIAEMALAAKKRGCTLLDELYRLYREHGVFQERQVSKGFDSGKTGMDQMAAVMNKLRTCPPKTLDILYTEDYKNSVRLYGNKTEKLELPISDVLLFRLKDGSRVVVRPSGTEPKLKIYASTSTKNFPSVEEGIKYCNQHLDTLTQCLS